MHHNTVHHHTVVDHFSTTHIHNADVPERPLLNPEIIIIGVAQMVAAKGNVYVVDIR